MTRVIVDRQAGFCAGVRRAIRGTSRLLSSGRPAPGRQPRGHGHQGPEPPAGTSGRVCLYGELVHNPSVNASLESRGLRIVRNLEELEAGSTLVVRSHGLPPAEAKALAAAGVVLADFTCPQVKRVQELIAQKRAQGYRILIVGERNHPEVRGFIGFAGRSCGVVASAQEARRVRSRGKIAVFAQTTITAQTYSAVVRELQNKGLQLSVENTLCPFVQGRQRWIERYSRAAEASLIIGGKNSSNTRKLYEIAAANGPAFLIESPEQADLEALLAFSVIAVSAGASTPDDNIEGLLDRFRQAGAEVERR